MSTEADHDSSSIERVEQLPPETRRAAGLVVCASAVSQPDPFADATRLVDMLGLRDEVGRKGCRVCGGPRSDWAIAPSSGMRGTCSRHCKQMLLDWLATSA